ncbi:hypothetical protein C8F04DRAFT_1389860 [Mycena alexandri]|uniref:RING-type domain-containing protein n=1 Tax=Mycena alexandri TaxID=1745969 RepID=A0AAD6TEP7_9AGAR|nr:hypothetical protein C8F04DRAFT_1389860 [Mycena alexandri]
MTTPKCHCDICLSELPIESFRRLKCGHCLCTTCIVGILKTRPLCPQCRAPVLEKDPQPIYLTIVGTKPIALVVAEGIEKMDAEAKLVSVRAAERKLQQVADEQKRVCGETMPELLIAIEDFKVRITPMFAKTRSQQTEIEALKKKLEEAEAMREQADRATGLAGELAILRTEQMTRVSELKDAYMKRDRERARADAADAQVLRAQRLEAEAEAEVRKLKGFLERGTEDRHGQKNKITGLQKDKADLEQQVQDLRSELWELRTKASARSEYTDLEIEETFPSEYSENSSPHRVSGSRSGMLAFEGMPQPGFGSDWQLSRGTKRKERDEVPSGFPLALSNGRTTIAVQIGPKHTRRVKVR